MRSISLLLMGLSFGLALTVAALPAVAQEGETGEPPRRVGDPLTEADEELRAAVVNLRLSTRETRSDAVRAVLDLDPERGRLIQFIWRDLPLPLPDAPVGWTVHEAEDESGVKRPYHLYVPKSAAEARRPTPLIVNMHGGVSRPAFIAETRFAGHRDMWTEVADQEGFCVAWPLGRADCTWWSDAGVAHVRATIRDVKRFAPIDDNRIVGTGFSDGGSGSFYLAMAAPDPFARLLPLNGHPAVASGASGRPLFLHNAVLTPLFIAMTQDDPLYPAHTILPHVERIMAQGGSAHTISYPTGGHTPSYFEEQHEAFAEFIDGANRIAFPTPLRWRTSMPAITGKPDIVRWIAIDEIGTVEGEGDAPDDDVNVMSTPGRVVLGFSMDRAYTGSGCRVDSVRDDSSASDIGLQDGDVIVGIDSTDTPGMAELRAVLGAKDHGDAIRVSADRGEERVTLTGRLRPFTARAIYTRESPVGRIEARFEGNEVVVTTHGVRRFRVLLSDAQFDLDEPIVVTVNGVERVRHRAEPVLGRLLMEYAEHCDGGRLFVDEIAIDLPAPPKDSDER